MKNYILLLLVFGATVQANQVDFFAQGLIDIVSKQNMSPEIIDKKFNEILKDNYVFSKGDKIKDLFVEKNSHYIQEWIEWISKQEDSQKRFEEILLPQDLEYSCLVLAYKNNLFDVAKMFIEKAPDIVTKPITRVKGRKMLLFELISNFENPFEISEYNNPIFFKNKPLWKEKSDQKVEIMLMMIEKINPEQLLTFEISSFPTALYKAVEHSCLEIIKPLLLKASKLIDPDLYGEGKNEVVEYAFSRYKNLQNYQENLLNGEIIDVRKNLIRAIIEYGFIDDNSKEFSDVLNFIFLNIFNTSLTIDTLKNGNEQFNDQFFDGLYEMFTVVVKKYPVVLKNRLVNCFEYFLKIKKNATRERAEQFLKYAINEFDRLYGKENFKFTIEKKDKKLIEKGLEADQSYTLEEILNAIGLKDLLKR